MSTYIEQVAARERRIGRAHVRAEANRVRRELGQAPKLYGPEALVDQMARVTQICNNFLRKMRGETQ